MREETAEVQLNAVELTITRVAAEAPDGTRLDGTATLDPSSDRLHLHFPRALRPGPWTLHIAFQGILNDQLHGFYRSTFKDAEGRTHVMAATQFEAVDARRAFPCWDEPALKAVFGITLVVPDGYAAISNGAPVREEPAGPGRRAVTFADTIRMSTYLVAFIVGELEATEPVMIGKTPLRVWCVPGKRHLAGFARTAGAFCLDFFERYYGIPYPGDTLDLLAIPDFASGAMENLGAITFRETALLVDEAAASHGELERVADVVAHEVAHMWFGDLVTMTWWNGIWLNEAFATFMEMLAVDAWKPEWKRWVSFGVSRAAAMGVDGLHASRPIEFEVHAPRDCEAMFDLLTYEKGASVLRMLEQHIGPDTFREGVRLYLRWHEYENAETTDLWKALGEASGQPIPEVMDGWVFHPGYPLVGVRTEGARLVLSQRRFTYLREPATPGAGHGADEPAQLWRVPVTVRASVAGKTVEQKVLMAASAHEVTLPGVPDWVVVNAGGHGFYRVGYAPPLLERLTADLEGLAPIERFGLVSDAFALTQAGDLDAPAFLELTARFRDETDRNVWAVVVGSLHIREPGDRRRGARVPRGVRAGPRRAGRPAARLGAAARGGRAHPPASRGPSTGARRARRRSRDPGPGPGALRPRQDRRARRRPERPAGPDRDPGARRRRGRVCRVPRPLPSRAEPAGGAALSLRAGRVPAARADRPDAPAHPGRRDPEPGRPLRGPRDPGERLGARARVGVRQGVTGRPCGASTPRARSAGCSTASARSRGRSGRRRCGPSSRPMGSSSAGRRSTSTWSNCASRSASASARRPGSPPTWTASEADPPGPPP